MRYRIYLACFSLVAPILGRDVHQTSEVVTQFENPPNEFRPKFRYWFPDASISRDSVQEDIRQIARIGAGGLEFLPFYGYGRGPVVTDWSIYGFGTDAFKKLFHAALDASATWDLKFDFAFGANQGAGVPSEVETIGLAKHLVYGKTTIQSGESFSGPIPEPILDYNQLTDLINPAEPWGSNEILAVVAAKIVSETPVSPPFSTAALDEQSLVDLTNIVSNNNLSWTAPAGNGTWIIFAIYERYTNQRSCVTIANATTALGNGSWIVDHWSANGAKKMTDFWDEQILSDVEIAALVRDVGGYAWEDSLELASAVPWTPDLSIRFEKLHGYNITKYLPFLFHPTSSWHGYLPPYHVIYAIGEFSADGPPFIQDYKTALSRGYVEYLEHYNMWASSRGVQLSTQAAYGMPVDMAQAITYVQVPETESLSFEASIDLYRQFTGPAHSAGRNIISTEIGAVRGAAYDLRLPYLKTLFDESFAAGVNKMVVHGYAYSGEYPNTTWPGYTPFQYLFSELWNPRQPAWRHLDEFFTYSARNSMVTRLGVPKVDVAFYYYQVPYQYTEIYNGSDMNQLGYTMEYLGADNLVSEQAAVEDGVLSPQGSAYRALVIYQQTQITPEASAALLEFAENRLPIYIVGTIPNITVGITGQQQVSANIEKLLTYDVVHVLSKETFSASTLAADGVPARTRVNAASNSSKLYTFRTSDTESKSEYVYLYNQGEEGVFNVTFSVSGYLVPYELDAWTGSQKPVTFFERGPTTITMDIMLNSQQTKLLAFVPDTKEIKQVHAADHSHNVLSVQHNEGGTLEAWVRDNSSAWVTLSNGANVLLPARKLPCAEVTDLDSWSLSVESHGPFLDRLSLEPNITFIDVGTLDGLVPWTEIPGLEHASGVGTYRTNFTVSVDNSTAMLLDLGPVLHTMKAWLNGQKVPAIDPSSPVVDVTDLIVAGNNSIEVEVTTTLFNAIKATLGRVLSVGSGPSDPTYFTDKDWQEFGLVGPVKLRAFRKVSFT